jgi:hypothetical protein
MATPVEATHQAWQVDPGIDEDDVTEYGWHYDESCSGCEWFGARDFNHPDDDSGVIVYLRTEAMQNLPFPIRYMRDSYDGGCGMQAMVQAYSGGWFTITGTEIRFLHIGLPSSGITSVMQLDGQKIYAQAGTIAHSGFQSGCMFGSPHLHQSARLGASFYYPRILSEETCWVDDSDDDDQCDYVDGDEEAYSRDHVDCPNDFASNGPYDKSGEIDEGDDEYICEEWSVNDHSENTWIFEVATFW